MSTKSKFDDTKEQRPMYNGAVVGDLIEDILEENYQLSKELLKICFRNETINKPKPSEKRKTTLTIITVFSAVFVFIYFVKFYLHI